MSCLGLADVSPSSGVVCPLKDVRGQLELWIRSPFRWALRDCTLLLPQREFASRSGRLRTPPRSA